MLLLIVMFRAELSLFWISALYRTNSYGTVTLSVFIQYIISIICVLMRWYVHMECPVALVEYKVNFLHCNQE